MIRKAAIALVLLISCLSSQIYALGLGRVTVESALNQPLRARIEILQLADTRPEDINAQLASFDDFQRFNVERVGYLSDIRFRVMTDANGPYVSVSSNQLVQEPYLNFILDTRWPSGRLLSEHTLLFDLPVFSDDASVEPVAIATTGGIAANAVPVVNADSAPAAAPPVPAPPVQTIRRVEEAVSADLDAQVTEENIEASVPGDSDAANEQPVEQVPPVATQGATDQAPTASPDATVQPTLQTEASNAGPLNGQAPQDSTAEEAQVTENMEAAGIEEPASEEELPNSAEEVPEAGEQLSNPDAAAAEETLEQTADEVVEEEVVEGDVVEGDVTEENAIEEGPAAEDSVAEDVAETALPEPEAEEAALAEAPAIDPQDSQEEEAPVPAAPQPIEDTNANAADELVTTDSDTLWAIALRTRPSREVSVQQTMLALQAENPDAFIDGNINRLRSGAVLRVPDLSNIRSVDQREAVAEVARQNQQAQLSPAPLTALSTNQPDSSGANRGELSVVTAQDAETSGQGGGAMEALDARIASLENLLMQAQEEADRARMQREELSDQLRQLDEQIGSAQELIRLQDLQLAQLQASLADTVNTALSETANQPEASAQDSSANADSADGNADDEPTQQSESSAVANEVLELSAEQNAALQADLQQAESAARPTSLVQDLVRILTGNILFVAFAVILVILLLVVLLLRRSRASRLVESEEAGLETTSEPASNIEAEEVTDPIADELPADADADGVGEREALDELLGLEEVVDEEFLPPEIDGLAYETDAGDFNYSGESGEAASNLDYTLPVDDEDDEDEDSDIAEEVAEVQSSETVEPGVSPLRSADDAEELSQDAFEVEFESFEANEEEPTSPTAASEASKTIEEAFDLDSNAPEQADDGAIEFDEPESEPSLKTEKAETEESVEFDLDDLDSFDEGVSFDEAFADENTIEIENIDDSLEDSEKLEAIVDQDVAQATLDIDRALENNNLDVDPEDVSIADDSVDQPETATDADTDESLSGEIDELEIEAFDLDDFDLDAIEPGDDKVSDSTAAGEAEVESIDFEIGEPAQEQTQPDTLEADEEFDLDAISTAPESPAGTPETDESDVESIDFDSAGLGSDEANSSAEDEEELELETFEFDIEENAADAPESEGVAEEAEADDELETFDFDVAETPSIAQGEAAEEAPATDDAIEFDLAADEEADTVDGVVLDDEGFLDLDELVEAADQHEKEKGDHLPSAVKLEDSEVDFDLDFDSGVATSAAAASETPVEDHNDTVEPAEADDIIFDFDDVSTSDDDSSVASAPSVEDRTQELDIADTEPGDSQEVAGGSPSGAAQSAAETTLESDSSEELDFELDDEIIDSGSSDSVELLGGADEVDTKLELAYAYQKMGDPEGAREILEEVLAEGNKQQKAEAQKLLDAS